MWLLREFTNWKLLERWFPLEHFQGEAELRAVIERQSLEGGGFDGDEFTRSRLENRAERQRQSKCSCD